MKNLVAVVARRWRPTASEVARPRLVAILAEAFGRKRMGRPRPAVYRCCSSKAKKYSLTYVYQKFTGGLNLYLTVPNSDVRSLLRSLDYIGRFIEAFELLNNFK
jgi:hypothetical protein